MGACGAGYIAGLAEKKRMTRFREHFAVSVGGLNMALYATNAGDPDIKHKIMSPWLSLSDDKKFYQKRHWYLPEGLSMAISLYRNNALYSNKPLRDIIRKHVSYENVKYYPAPIHVVATDVAAKSHRLFTLQDAKSAKELERMLLATAALFPILEPVRIDGRLYADGGFRSPDPTIDFAIPAAMEDDIIINFRLSRGKNNEGDYSVKQPKNGMAMAEQIIWSMHNEVERNDTTIPGTYIKSGKVIVIEPAKQIVKHSTDTNRDRITAFANECYYQMNSLSKTLFIVNP